MQNIVGRSILLLILLIVLFVTCSTDTDITIHLIGDSTMANKSEPENNPERGWGQVLQQFFNEHVTIKNYARNGRSTKSFIGEGRWDEVLANLKSGDYVFIQFGHNDQKFKDPNRYTNPFTGYRANLIRYIKETRSKGAKPVLFSSIVRRKFNEHGTLIDTHGEYPFVVRDVAREYDVPFVDLQFKSENLVLGLGEEKSKEIYLWVEPGVYPKCPDGKQDNTHFSEKGAIEMARLAVEGIRELNLDLSDKIVIPDNTSDNTQQ